MSEPISSTTSLRNDIGWGAQLFVGVLLCFAFVILFAEAEDELCKPDASPRTLEKQAVKNYEEVQDRTAYERMPDPMFGAWPTYEEHQASKVLFTTVVVAVLVVALLLLIVMAL